MISLRAVVVASPPAPLAANPTSANNATQVKTITIECEDTNGEVHTALFCTRDNGQVQVRASSAVTQVYVRLVAGGRRCKMCGPTARGCRIGGLIMVGRSGLHARRFRESEHASAR